MVVFFIFAYGNMDPMNCWVANGELWVSQEATGWPNERDVGATWRLLYKILIWIYISLSFVPTIHGVLLCAKASIFIRVGFGVSTYIAFFVKSAAWWWAVILRASQEGRVASGKEIVNCTIFNPELAFSVVESTGRNREVL